ncbi:MAG TPA: MATE family efflux transporter [Candidatus Acidoferrales bacterium]|nr:MATE family efflux transporter [Candidatus Acidoferrales bacterium]
MWQSLLVFLVPLMLSNVLQSLGQTIGFIYLGRFLGPQALAAAGNLFPIIFLMISFLLGVGGASSILIGQAHGAGDTDRMQRVAGTTLGLGLSLGVIGGALCAIFVRPLLHLIGTPADIFDMSAGYARVFFAGFPLLFTYLLYSTFLRGTGDSKTPFYSLIVSTVLTMAITPALILGWFGLPKLGVIAGAAGNITATTLTLVILGITLAREHNSLAPSRELLRAMAPNVRLVLTLLRLGAPMGVQMIMVSLAEIAVITFVNHFGSDATAAYAAVNQIGSYVQFPALSIGIAASIFGAQSIGAGRTELLGSVVRSSVALNYIIEGALILIVYGFANVILGMFLTSEHTHHIARGLLNITLWSYAIFGNATVISGIVRSSGTVLVPMLISIFSIWGVEVPVAWTLSHHIGLAGVWYGYPAAFIVNVSLQFAYYELVWRRKPLQAIR